MEINKNDLLKIKKEQSEWMKLLAFVLILALCFFLGNVALLLLASAGGITISSSFDIFDSVSDPAMRPYLKTGIGFNHLIIFTGTALLFAYWLKRNNWKRYFEFKSIDAILMMSFVLLLFCAYPLIGYSASVFEGVEWASQIDEGSIEALMKMLQMDSIWDLFVNLFIIALLPAIGEELLFRGVIQKELLLKIKNHHIAIIIASVIFSGVHLQIQGFLPKFIIGLILGYAYFWTKSIWYPMILHFINNGLQTLIIYYVGDKVETIQEEAIQPEMWQLLMGVVISCFLCSFIISNIRKRLDEKNHLDI